MRAAQLLLTVLFGQSRFRVAARRSEVKQVALETDRHLLVCSCFVNPFRGGLPLDFGF